MTNTDDDYAAALDRAREETSHYPRHEPSAWLRASAEAAVLRLAANGSWRAGVSVIAPLVQEWPPPSPDRPSPVHLCVRCGASASTPVRGRFQTCGFQLTAPSRLPGVLLKLCFELCVECAVREYGPGAAHTERGGDS